MDILRPTYYPFFGHFSWTFFKRSSSPDSRATEFLPVSSSGHLAALNIGFGWSKDGIITHIIAVHFGTVFAVMGYFWRDMLRLGKGVMGLLRLAKKP